MYMKVFACVHVCTSCVYLLPAEVKGGHLIPRNTSYSHKVSCACWELNLAPQQELQALNSRPLPSPILF